jgi:signal peptidase II
VNLTHRLLLLFALLGFSVGCDQATKVMAVAELQGKPTSSYLGDTFRFTFATNDGAFLSLGSRLPDAARFGILTVAVGLLLLGIVIYTALNSKLNRMQVAGYAMIAGGGLSNWMDRARNGGSVVDFMNLGIGRLRTGIFNVADLVLLVGIGFLLYAGWKHERDQKRRALDGAATP